MSFIAKAVASGLASELFKRYGGAITGDKPFDIEAQLRNITNTIQTSEKRIIEKVDEIVDKSSYRTEVTKIINWEKSLATEIRRRVQGSDSNEWTTLSNKWFSQRDDGGINATLTSINSILTSEATVGTAGLLRVYVQNLHTELETNDPAKGLQWYLTQIDDYLAAAMSIQLKGLALQIFMSSGSSDPHFYINKYQREMMEQLNNQIRFTYESMHSTVRQLKRDYASPIDYSHWWTLRREDGGLLHCWEGDKRCRIENRSVDSGNSWRFVEVGENHYLYNPRDWEPIKGTLFQRKDGWGRKHWRQHLRCTKDAAYTERDGFDTPEEKVSEQDPIKVKIAPIKGSDRFYLKATSDWDGDNNHDAWFFNIKWKLDDAGVTQVDQPARAPLLTLEGKRIKGHHTNDVDIYFVLDQQLRHVSGSEVAVQLFGDEWSAGVETANRFDFQWFPKGERLWGDCKLVQGSDQGVYLIDNGKKRHVIAGPIMTKYGFSWSKVQHIGDGISNYPSAPAVGWNLPLYEGKRLRGTDGTIYLVLEGKLRHVYNGMVYNGLFGTNNHTIITQFQNVIDEMPKGTALMEPHPLRQSPDGKVYLIDEGKKRWIRDGETFNKYEFDGAQIQKLVNDTFPDGPQIWLG